MPRRRDRILGFDRLNGIEIADLADRLMEVWPDDASDAENIARAHGHVDALERSAEQLTRLAADLRAELGRIERGG